MFNDSLDEEDSLVPHLPVSEFLPELPTSEPTALKLNESFLDNSLSELDTQLPFGFEEEFKQNTKDGQDTTLGENMNDSLCENGENNSYELKTPPLQKEKLTGNSGNSSSTPSHSAGSINRGSPSILIKRTPSIPIRRTPLKVSSPSQKPDAPKLKPSFGKKKISIKVDKGNETASIPLLEANTPGVDSAAKTNSTATSDISDNGSASGNGTKKAKAENKKKLKKSKVGSSGGGTNEDTSSCKVNIQKTTTKKILSSEEKEARKVKCEQAKSEREAKKKENEEKKTEREQKKVENEKLKEQKRLDAEQKKAEREQTKIENEKLKEQKHLDAEQKKAEREQIKIDKELKKIETLEKKLAGKTSQLTIGEKSESSIKVEEKITAGENKENEDPSSQETINHQNETVKIAEKPGPLGEISLSPNLPPTSRVNNASIHQEEINSSDDKNKNSTTVNTDTLLYEKDQSSIIEKSIKRFEPPKMKDRESKPPKPKKKKPDLKKIGSKKPFESKRSSIKSKNLKRKRSLSDDSEDDSVQKPKRSKSVNYSGPVWVQCDNIGCQKWRKLVNCKDPSEVPEEWMCSRNTDPEYNRCSAPEEEWSDLKDSQEFVESMFVPGSIVWAKLEGYPWLVVKVHTL